MSSLASTRKEMGLRESPVPVASRTFATNPSSDLKKPGFFLDCRAASMPTELAVYLRAAERVAKVKLSPVRSERIWRVANNLRVWALPSNFSRSFRYRCCDEVSNVQKSPGLSLNHPWIA